MYIRRTSINSRRTGEPYYTYRLVESVRCQTQVRQRTLLNLGRHFRIPRAQWAPLARRIEALCYGQLDLMPDDLDGQWECVAQEYAARLVRNRGELDSPTSATAVDEPDYQQVDLASLDLIRPRSVGVEHVALGVLRQLGLDRKLQALGFNGQEVPRPSDR